MCMGFYTNQQAVNMRGPRPLKLRGRPCPLPTRGRLRPLRTRGRPRPLRSPGRRWETQPRFQPLKPPPSPPPRKEARWGIWLGKPRDRDTRGTLNRRLLREDPLILQQLLQNRYHNAFCHAQVRMGYEKFFYLQYNEIMLGTGFDVRLDEGCQNHFIL